MIEKIGTFILFLGPLVFFHELGHFLFARLFKVKVEIFSLGFGPKIFRFVRGGTEYALSLIPLGGYVKMYGDDVLARDEIPKEKQKHSFSHQSKWARFLIVFGGPMANIVLAFFIYFGLVLSGEKVPEIRLGNISENTVLFRKGFRSGDLIKKYDNQTIYNLADLAMEEKKIINILTIQRKELELDIPLNMQGKQFFETLIKHPPILRRPLLVSKNGNFFILSKSSEKVDWETPLESMSYEFGQRNYYLFDYLPNLAKGKVSAEIFLKFSSNLDFFTALEKYGYLPSDLVIKSVKMNSPADLAKLRAGDILVELAGKSIYSFEDLRVNLQGKAETEIAYLRKGQKVKVKIRPSIVSEDGLKRKVIGVYTSGELFPMKFIALPSPGIYQSILFAAQRTTQGIDRTLMGFKKLIFGEVSLNNIGGPLSIGKVASDSYNSSLTLFLQLMAFISINLGIINLFPIPILDGGHIVFIIIELVNRGPLSRKKMEMAQQVGLSILLMLMVGAIFNDFSRFF